MSRYIAFLRGINLGNRRIKMDHLRGLFQGMKFTEVATFIASGNVIFASKVQDSRKLEEAIQRALKSSLGYEVNTFVRTREEIAAIAAFQPFSQHDMTAPENTAHCGFFREPLSLAQARGFMACRTDVDELRIEGREYYWLCRIKSHESKLWASPRMRALKLPSSSMRNLTTLRKLAALHPADGQVKQA